MTNDKLKRLEAQKQEISKKIRAIKNAENREKRKNDTRRKILLGSLLEHLDSTGRGGLFVIDEGNPKTIDINRALDGFLTRQSDRDLFGLQPNGGNDESL